MDNPIDFKLILNCTSSCQNAVIGASSKIQLSFATHCNDVYLREYNIFMTVCANLKKKYDDHMAQLDGSSEEDIPVERTRKRRRTSRFD